jgi:hypothetical protein
MLINPPNYAVIDLNHWNYGWSGRDDGAFVGLEPMVDGECQVCEQYPLSVVMACL